jgi:ubiquinone/menaquinone biosynthesis C-methylase UbiE
VIERTIDSATAQRFYDRLGAGHDRTQVYEARAKRRALELLAPQPGMRLLNLGAGTGLDHGALVEAVGPAGIALAVDISPVMLGVLRARTGAPVVRADCRALPLADATVDAALCAYLLDLIEAPGIASVLAELARVLRLGGRLVCVSLTDGVGPLSRATMAAWSAVHRLHAALLGGCRPVRLEALLGVAGFTDVHREVVVQAGIPSEVVSAQKDPRP